MYQGQTIFAQIMSFIPRHSFNRHVRNYDGDKRVRKFSCRNQFMTMAFAQITGRQSLRDIESCLRAAEHKLYHSGFRLHGGQISRSTLANANENRDWRIWADLAKELIQHARELYASDALEVELEQTVYALDSTTIDLCLVLFPWASFRKHKGAIKLHTMIDLRGSIPCFIRISDGKEHDVNTLDYIPIEPGAYYVMDKGYIDFERLYRFEESKAFFVTREKKNMDFVVRESRPVDKSTGLRCDQTIELQGKESSKAYPQQLRRISYVDPDTGKRLVFITNNFALSAIIIAMLYKERWQVELFFKWIKQNLRIKVFYGTSPNAVKTQVWIAVCVYVLVAIIAKEKDIPRSPSEILKILGIMIFEQVSMDKAFIKIDKNNNEIGNYKQLPLFDL